MRRRYVIVGAGAAGLAAAERLARLDPGSSVILLTQETVAPYSRPLLTDYLAGVATTGDLALPPDRTWGLPGVTLRRGARVEAVEPAQGRVVLASGERVDYDALLVATGADPAVPPALTGHPRVTPFRSLADARRVRRATASGRRVVVLGAGVLGIKVTTALVKAGARGIVLLEARARPLVGVVDAEGAVLAARRLAQGGVDLRCGVTVVAVEGPKRQKSTGGCGEISLLLSDGGKLAADLVVACTGVAPAVRLLAGVAATRRGVTVDETMRTTAAGIFAAGDLVETLDLVTGEWTVAATWTHARVQGRVAASNMAGRPATFAGVIRRNVVDVLGLGVASMGVVDPPPGREWSSVITSRRGGYRKLVFRNGLPAGALLVGETDAAGLLLAGLMKGKWESDGPGADLRAESVHRVPAV